MTNNLKFFISSAMIVLIFSEPHAIQGMDDTSKPQEQQKSSMLQLSKGADDTLEAVLGTGNDVLLKLNTNLNILRRPIEKEQLEKGQLDIPFRLFLSDFKSSPTAHPPVDLTIKVDCESTLPIYTVPNKPPSFDSYSQFTDWLKGGYFTNQVRIVYDFHVDVRTVAPLLAQHLLAVAPEGYHFIGTYAVDNTAIQPDESVPQVSYISKRNNENMTLAMLSGTLYLNKKPYSVYGDQQTFPHPIIDQIVFKKDEAKKFYSHKWLARSEATARVTYEEFPNHLVQNWPNAPTGSYNILKTKPDDLEEIRHLACWDGVRGREVDISDGRVFSIDCEAINKLKLREGLTHQIESIVKDDAGYSYIMLYQYPEEVEQEKIKAQHEEATLREKQGISIREAMIDECLHLLKTYKSCTKSDERIYFDAVIDTFLKERIIRGDPDNPHTILCYTILQAAYNSKQESSMSQILAKGKNQDFLPHRSRIIGSKKRPLMRATAQLMKYNEEEAYEQVIPPKAQMDYLVSVYIEESMEQYKARHGIPHPRWAEFLNME